VYIVFYKYSKFNICAVKFGDFDLIAKRRGDKRVSQYLENRYEEMKTTGFNTNEGRWRQR